MIKETIENFNSIHSRLNFTYQFTYEFLNLLIIKNQADTIEANWYRKNTYSGRYLNYFSKHPFQQKIAIFKNLIATAILLSHENFDKKFRNN